MRTRVISVVTVVTAITMAIMIVIYFETRPAKQAVKVQQSQVQKPAVINTKLALPEEVKQKTLTYRTGRHNTAEIVSWDYGATDDDILVMVRQHWKLGGQSTLWADHYKKTSKGWERQPGIEENLRKRQDDNDKLMDEILKDQDKHK